MTTVHIRQSIPVPLKRLAAALIDFGPGRERASAKGTSTGSAEPGSSQ
jgi:hypothetical protein